ncbi:hypothetical protein SAMN05216532_8196 [Streptomyces sp. 2231.1]|nr:hypothetical protein SAMN05216532_8196 [Streptomyces sp. 2231.1]
MFFLDAASTSSDAVVKRRRLRGVRGWVCGAVVALAGLGSALPTAAATPEPVKVESTVSAPAVPAPSESGGAAQAPVTVEQPPGVSAYVPVEYLLPLVVAFLIVYAASRPGGREAVRALLELVRGRGGGMPPVG